MNEERGPKPAFLSMVLEAQLNCATTMNISMIDNAQ